MCVVCNNVSKCDYQYSGPEKCYLPLNPNCLNGINKMYLTTWTISSYIFEVIDKFYNATKISEKLILESTTFIQCFLCYKNNILVVI